MTMPETVVSSPSSGRTRILSSSGLIVVLVAVAKSDLLSWSFLLD
jgi:hypothetical protein